MNINRDIQSLTEFKLHTPEYVQQLKETGEPLVLTINGKAELVVMDATLYQKLIDAAGRAEELEITRQSVADMKAGRGRPAEEMLAEMRQILEANRGR